MSVKPQIKFEKVNFSYGANKVLNDISFEISQGSYLGIIGPNGGGKTTLVKIMLGLLKPNSGKVTIDQKSIAQAIDESRIGYVPQRISQEYMDLPATIYEIVESGVIAKSNLFRSFGHEKIVTETLARAGLKGMENRLIGELSGGQRQRAFVARALAIDPEILVLDEPFVGIDLASQEEFYEFLKNLNKEKKMTIIFISHDLDMISKQAQEILCLNHSIIYSGKASEVDEQDLVEGMYGKTFTHIHHEH